MSTRNFGFEFLGIPPQMTDNQSKRLVPITYQVNEVLLLGGNVDPIACFCSCVITDLMKCDNRS